MSDTERLNSLCKCRGIMWMRFEIGEVLVERRNGERFNAFLESRLTEQIISASSCETDVSARISISDPSNFQTPIRYERYQETA